MAFTEGVANGCFGQDVSVQPGECYAVAVRVRKTGIGVPALHLRWKGAAGAWMFQDDEPLWAVTTPGEMD